MLLGDLGLTMVFYFIAEIYTIKKYLSYISKFFRSNT